MKVIITGSRSIHDYDVVKKAIANSGFEITEEVSGFAVGVDALGVRWARQNGIPVKRFKADWSRYGNSAGIIRNVEMAEYADALIAVWDGKSKGTQHMIRAARKAGLRVFTATAEPSSTEADEVQRKINFVNRSNHGR